MVCRYDKAAQIITVNYDRNGKAIVLVPSALPYSAGEQFWLGWLKGESIRLLERNEARLIALAASYTEGWCTKHQILAPEIILRRNNKYWGRCSPEKNLVSLHPDLSRMPDDTAAEAVLHELCHMIYKDHSESFWRLMTQEMPDWPEKEGVLRCLGKRIRAERRQSSRTVTP